MSSQLEVKGASHVSVLFILCLQIVEKFLLLLQLALQLCSMGFLVSTRQHKGRQTKRHPQCIHPRTHQKYTHGRACVHSNQQYVHTSANKRANMYTRTNEAHQISRAPADFAPVVLTTPAHCAVSPGRGTQSAAATPAPRRSHLRHNAAPRHAARQRCGLFGERELTRNARSRWASRASTNMPPHPHTGRGGISTMGSHLRHGAAHRPGQARS